MSQKPFIRLKKRVDPPRKKRKREEKSSPSSDDAHPEKHIDRANRIASSNVPKKRDRNAVDRDEVKGEWLCSKRGKEEDDDYQEDYDTSDSFLERSEDAYKAVPRAAVRSFSSLGTETVERLQVFVSKRQEESKRHESKQRYSEERLAAEFMSLMDEVWLLGIVSTGMFLFLSMTLTGQPQRSISAPEHWGV